MKDAPAVTTKSPSATSIFVANELPVALRHRLPEQ